MKKVKKLIASALVLSTVLSVTGCADNSSKVVLAEVNGKKITLADVDLELTPYINYLKEENGKNFEDKLDEQTRIYFNSQRATALNQIIQEEVLILKAKELNLIPSDEDLDKKADERIAELEEYYGGKEELEEAKKSYSYTDETFRTFIKNQVIQEIVVEEITKDVEVTDDEIKTYYEDNKDTYFTQNPGAITQHILFENEEDANKCYDEINSGKTTFEDAFKLYSENAGTENYPLSENLGFVEYEQENYDKDFLEGLKPLKENEVSKPVKSSFGYHVIKVTEVSKDKTISKFDDVKDSIKEQIIYDKKYELYQNKLIEWKESLGVKITADVIGYNPEEE